MTDRMHPQDGRTLLAWINSEEKRGTIFGVHRDLFFRADAAHPFRIKRYGRVLDTPLGVAAGPQTQLVQNLVTAWLTGARYLELKTVQTLDELEVSKPCIDMEDAGYNCEWSQELRLRESLDQYLITWVLLHILARRHGMPGPGPGFLCNMSVGYNMEGILQPNVQAFFAGMADCGPAKRALIESLRDICPEAADLDIPDTISDNITLSTMHGCPPDEIGKIGLYLINEKKLNTTIKLNPTLLGPERLRSILNDQLGFETTVPDAAFDHDLKYPDALNLIRTLRDAAAARGVAFGIKLTNTLECLNHRGLFPEKEKMMYMSGRALHPLSVNLAAQLQEEFGGELDISFSAGADCFNVADLIAAGLKPVTVSSDLLKPGGYGRLSQYMEELAAAMQGCSSIEEFITSRAGTKDVRKAALQNLVRYAAAVSGEKSYKKSHYPERSVKTARPLTPFDCVKAPCVTTCPASQEVPEYMYHTASGDWEKALEVILRTNPLPTVTGMVCDHLCMTKCTRINYDDPLRIRDIKRFVVEQTAGVKEPRPLPANGQRVAVIGAGPAGLSCAWFAALAGFAVDVYEAKPFAGGMAADAIPAFRLSDEQIRQDIARIERLGVHFHFNERIDADRFAALRGEARFVFVGLGAQENKGMGIPGEELSRVYGALAFLSSVRRGQPLPVGKRVAVVGGGNSAMDAARTAWRLGAAVTLLYRRTMHEMPADREELEAIIEEGVTIRELVGPAAIAEQDGALAVRCDLMRLGEPDESGRRRPEKSGREETLLFDSVIMAIGQAVRPDIGAWQTFQADPFTCETRMDGVYAGGDLVHGALNLITGIADGRHAAEDMMRRSGIELAAALGHANKGLPEGQLQFRSARRQPGTVPAEAPVAARRGFTQVIGSLGPEQARAEAARCLYCSDVCNVCVTVCPNRANFGYRTAPADYKVSVLLREGEALRQEVLGRLRVTQRVQVCNIADFCNECGNCRTFCPTAGAPYQDKPRVCLSEAAFGEQEVAWLFCLLDGKPGLKYRQGERIVSLQFGIRSAVYTAPEGTVHLSREDLSFISGEITAARLDLSPAAAMAVLLEGLSDTHLVDVIRPA